MAVTPRVDAAESEDLQTSHRVLEAVAEETGVSPLEIDRPLYEAIDPDALDALFRHGRSETVVEFAYLGCRVRVFGDGEVAVAAENR